VPSSQAIALSQFTTCWFSRDWNIGLSRSTQRKRFSFPQLSLKTVIYAENTVRFTNVLTTHLCYVNITKLSKSKGSWQVDPAFYSEETARFVFMQEKRNRLERRWTETAVFVGDAPRTVLRRLEEAHCWRAINLFLPRNWLQFDRQDEWTSSTTQDLHTFYQLTFVLWKNSLCLTV